MPSGSRSSSSAPPGNTSGPLNPNLPFPSSPDPPPSQNPLSLMMSQMSKYAMPSSTPLYHNAIKTIATSDDELLPDRPLLPPGAMSGKGGLGEHSEGRLWAPVPLDRPRSKDFPWCLSAPFPGSQWASRFQMGPDVGASCLSLMQALWLGTCLCLPNGVCCSFPLFLGQTLV